jgi:hypothetical protein
MKVIPGSRKHHYVARASIFLIAAVLVWAMIGCTEVYPTEYELTITSTTGGSVVSPREATSMHIKGERVTLIAIPDNGYRFVRWTGDVRTIGNVKSAHAAIAIGGEYSITAEFERIPEYRVTVSTTVGGQVMKPKEAISIYKGEKRADLEAHEDAGFGFISWTGDVGTVADVNAAVTTIWVDGNYSIRANFEEEEAVNITDSNLEAAIRAATGISTRPIYPADLKRLTSLEAEAKNVSNLAALEYCTGLITLKLGGNQIDDISAVANLAGLAYLYLTGNQIDDISPVANLTNLRKLHLSANQIDDISPLANLTSLTELYLSGNRISDISPLANLKGLTYLYLSSNQIDDISPVVNLTSLTELYLSGNRISDISPLANLGRLRGLSLAGNQIDDISPLADLSNLTLLNLSNNQISDIEPLVDNPGLSKGDKVYLYNNPLSYSPMSYGYVSIYIAQLVVRGVIVEY